MNTGVKIFAFLMKEKEEYLPYNVHRSRLKIVIRFQKIGAVRVEDINTVYIKR